MRVYLGSLLDGIRWLVRRLRTGSREDRWRG